MRCCPHHPAALILVGATLWAHDWIRISADVVSGDENSSPAPIFIEDAFQQAISPKVHVLFGVNAAGRLLSTDADKRAWQDLAPFDFPRQAASASSRGHLAGAAVRIFVHRVPRCAGEELLDHFTVQKDGFGWTRAMQLHAEHAAAVHRAIIRSDAIVDNMEDATVFYIPAFFGLLVERWLDTHDPGALNCMVRAWNDLPDEVFLRNAGYDHFIVAGTCHPFSVCGTMECDVTNYHPFAVNVMVLVGGVREYGHPDGIFKPAAMYTQLRQIFVPFPVTLDCARLQAFSSPDHVRPVVLSFIGSENSRVRRLFRETIEDESWPYRNDRRVFIRILPDDQESARRIVLTDGTASSNMFSELGFDSVFDLYAASELCLMLPGHIYDFGRRGYDFMAQGCVPVVVTEAPLAVALPFPGQIPWEEIAIFAHITSHADIIDMISSLLASAATPEGAARIGQRRQALVQHAPRLYLPPHTSCGDLSAVDCILGELGVRLASWTSLRGVRPKMGEKVVL